MPEIHNAILSYLKHEKVKIDKSEFLFQFKSHSDYPSLLAISDTLDFFAINNGGLKIKKSEINVLPSRFVAQLNGLEAHSFYYINRKNENYEIERDLASARELISFEELQKQWIGPVFLIEKNDFEVNPRKTSTSNFILLGILFILISFLLYLSFFNLITLSFYVLPFLGLLLSIGAFRVLLESESELLSKFCKINSDSNEHSSNSEDSGCISVISSSKWTFLETLDLTSLSLSFFSAQILTFLIMGMMDKYDYYFSIQFILLVISLPLIGISLFYQKFIIKKWCNICLAIVSVIVLEISFLFYTQGLYSWSIDFLSITLYSAIYIGLVFVWKKLKNLFVKLKELEDERVESNRLIRNYNLFKNTLTASKRIGICDNPLIFGNENAALKLYFVINPYCGHCVEPHNMLRKLLIKHNKEIDVRYFFKLDTTTSNGNDLELLIKNLIHTKLVNGNEGFYDALDDWYYQKDEKKWLSKYHSAFDETHVNRILKNQYNWCSKNNLDFTPILIINGYQYPNIYNLKDFPFYINELLNDESYENFSSKTVSLEALNN